MRNSYILSIITINRNNGEGLDKTIQSVLSQTSPDFEFIIVDGASTDDSVEIIRRYEDSFGERLKWVSEKDHGIYNAMNKGIGMASGDYVQFLNSGDCLASENITGKMFLVLQQEKFPSILYGNMLKDMPDGTVVKDKCFAGQDITFLGFYSGTLNHSPAYIKRGLFEKYGKYDESLKIVSDWKWYMKAIVFGEEKPVYRDLDVTLFDMQGISETNKELDKAERKMVLSELVSPAILVDYDNWAFSISQVKRLKRYPFAFKAFWFMERCLFKWEKHKNNQSGIRLWQ